MPKFDKKYLHTIIWFQVWLSNTNNLFSIIWFQVTIPFDNNNNNNNNNNSFDNSQMVSSIPV